MRRVLSNYQKIGIDTNIFIYFLDKNSPYYLQTVSLFTTFIKKQSALITSVLTLTEILSIKISESQLLQLEEDIILMPNLQLTTVDRAIAKMAARIRRNYDFSLVDSIQLATALENDAEVFITNDKKLQLFKDIPVFLLTSF